jgi:hypothetical protein
MATQPIDLGSTTEVNFNGQPVEKINLDGTEIWTKPSSGYAIRDTSVWGVPNFNNNILYYFVWVDGSGYGSNGTPPIAPNNPYNYTSFFGLLERSTGILYSAVSLDTGDTNNVSYISVDLMYSPTWSVYSYYKLGPEITEWGAPIITCAWAQPVGTYIVATK